MRKNILQLKRVVYYFEYSARVREVVERRPRKPWAIIVEEARLFEVPRSRRHVLLYVCAKKRELRVRGQ